MAAEECELVESPQLLQNGAHEVDDKNEDLSTIPNRETIVAAGALIYKPLPTSRPVTISDTGSKVRLINDTLDEVDGDSVKAVDTSAEQSEDIVVKQEATILEADCKPELESNGNSKESTEWTVTSTQTTAMLVKTENTTATVDNGTSANTDDQSVEASSLVGRPEHKCERKVGIVEILFIFFSICFAIIDIGFDIAAAVTHSRSIQTEPFKFIFTVTVLSVSAFATGFLNMFWFHKDSKRKAARGQCRTAFEKRIQVLHIVLSVVSLSSVSRCLEYIYWARVLNAKKCKDITKSEENRYLNKRSSATWLKMVESLFEAAPQFCVQLTIFFTYGVAELSVIGSIVTSIIFVPWNVMRCKETLQKRFTPSFFSKEGLVHLGGCTVAYLWRLFEIIPRLAVLALFTSVFHEWVILILGLHWLFMLVWMKYFLPTVTESNSVVVDFILKSLHALSWIVCFLNVQRGPTRKTAVLFYAVFYLENVVMVTLWYLRVGPMNHAWHLPLLISVIASIVPMVIFMVLYYKYCHHHSDNVNENSVSFWNMTCYKDAYTSEESLEEMKGESNNLESEESEHEA